MATTRGRIRQEYRRANNQLEWVIHHLLTASTLIGEEYPEVAAATTVLIEMLLEARDVINGLHDLM